MRSRARVAAVVVVVTAFAGAAMAACSDVGDSSAIPVGGQGGDATSGNSPEASQDGSALGQGQDGGAGEAAAQAQDGPVPPDGGGGVDASESDGAEHDGEPGVDAGGHEDVEGADGAEGTDAGSEDAGTEDATGADAGHEDGGEEDASGADAADAADASVNDAAEEPGGDGGAGQDATTDAPGDAAAAEAGSDAEPEGGGDATVEGGVSDGGDASTGDGSAGDGAADGGAEAAADAGLGPCTPSNPTGCVQCQGNATTFCSPTEADFVAHDIAKGIATAPGPDPDASCYTCLLNGGCLDDTVFVDTGKECEDPLTAGTTAECQAVIACILGATCATVAVSGCYCGTAGVSTACQGNPAPGPINGACASTIAAGLGFPVSDGTDVTKNLTDVTKAAGRADQIFQCAQSNTCAACLQ